MSEQDTEQEPSIEEILTSIRQIISDDDEEAGDAEDTVEVDVDPIPEPEPEEEIINLTEKLDEPEPESEPEAIDEPEPKPEEIEVEMQDTTPAQSPAENDLGNDSDTILSNNAEDAAYDAFSELAKKTAVEHGGITVEEIVRSELRPMLKGWLDKNLPSIIERLVQEELERVAKRAMDE